MLLSNRIALITGAGQGIGRQIALAFQDHGAEALVLMDIDLARADAVAHEIKQKKGKALALKADVTNLEDVRSAFSMATAELGRVDILVNNAGGGYLQPFIDTQPSNWDFDIKLNLYGVIHCTHVAIGPMVERKYGKIVSVVSEAGRMGETKLATYSAAKAGVVGFAKALARELGKHHITVNCVAAGATRTPLLEQTLSGLTEEQKKSMLKSYPLRKWGEPQDVANGVLFLASDLSSHVTGQTLSVSGGFAMI